MPRHEPRRTVHLGVIALLILGLLGATGCGRAVTRESFSDARKGFQTRLLRHERIGEPAETPPPETLLLVSYPAPLGTNRAYVSPRPVTPAKLPAVIWLVGGFSNSIGDIAWTPGPRQNDQSASAFRSQPIVMLYPSLRGGNDNPGSIETFAGEIDDVLAATRYLTSLDYVDPTRIYLGGHSTGGTLALLVAAAGGDRYRAVFALGPVDDVAGYGADVLPFDLTTQKELELRAPKRWLQDIRCPTFVFEGTVQPSNIGSLRALARVSTNPNIHFTPTESGTHFSIIAPLVEELAASIVADTAQASAFQLRSRDASK